LFEELRKRVLDQFEPDKGLRTFRLAAVTAFMLSKDDFSHSL